MSANCKTHLYAGPSLNNASRALLAAHGDWVLHDPVKRGDLPALALQGGDRVVLADGLFHQELAVGHAEIRALLESDIAVWGVASMGAIRAYEMRHWGMQAYGQIARWFYELTDFQDDEVTLLHEPGPEYRAVSEPLIHIRYCLQDLHQRGLIKATAQQAIAEELKGLWYGDRSLRRLKQAINRHTDENADALIAAFEPYRVKETDLYALIHYLTAL